jgi:hypothetical protein
LDFPGLAMTDACETRDLARRLVAYEAGASKSSKAVESPTFRVYEKLHASLVASVGVAGFQSLALRALTLARRDSAGLEAATIGADGRLQGVFGREPVDGLDKESVGESVGDVGFLLIARLLELLRMFLGEALTLSLLRTAWPSEVFHDGSAKQGRKA